MSIFKRMTGYLLTVCLVVSLFNVSYAETDTRTSDDKATILEELNILKGNGTDFALDDQLKRSEAATFIVRLMGKEDVVNDQKAKYTNSGFTDVSDMDWFVQYVGYCKENGIIDGYLDNTFKPNDYVSEKGFLKLLLTAMGYVYNEDFTWNEVYATAYEAGIVDDSTYLTKVDDNTTYTRRDVVEVIYTTLQSEHKVTKMRMAQSFIDMSVITIEAAESYGLIEDDIQTEIVSIKTIDEHTLEISFNEPLNAIAAENILFYEKTLTSNDLGIKSVERLEDELTYELVLEEVLIPDREYYIMIKNAVDNYGNRAPSMDKLFTGYRPDVIISDYFKISRIDPVSNNMVYLYFTHPINDNVLQPSLYKLKLDGTVVAGGSGLDIKLSILSTSNSGVAVLFEDYSFSDEGIYELIVDGDAVSQYGVNLNDGNGDNIKFEVSVDEEEGFKLENISTYSNNTIELTFNQAVNQVIAEQVFSYYLTSNSGTPIEIGEASVLVDGQKVRLTVKTKLVKDNNYILMINNINDISRQFSITEQSYNFVVEYIKVDNVEIESAYAVDAGSIVIKVSRPLSEESALTTTSYQVFGVAAKSFSATPSVIYYDKLKDSKSIKLFLPKGRVLVNGEDYEVRLMTTVEDELGNRQSGIEKIVFTNTKSSIIDIYIKEAVVVGENTVKLVFSKEIGLEISNILNTNYELTYEDNGTVYSKTPISANYIDPQTMILRFNQLDENVEYEILFDSLIDYTGRETSNTGGRYSIEVIRN